MKKVLFLTISLLAIISICRSQQSGIDAFYIKYKPLEKASPDQHRHWVKKLAEGLVRFEDINALLADPAKLRIIILEKDQPDRADLKRLQKEASTVDGFYELVRVRDKKEEFLDLFAKTAEGKISNVLFLVEEHDQFVFLTLNGAWSLKDLMESSRAM